MSVLDKLKKIKAKQASQVAPLWAGPNGEGDNGGVTQGLLGRYISCPERARVKLMEGLGPPDRFSPIIEYGNFWHSCEEALAADPVSKWPAKHWSKVLTEQAKALAKKYPLDQQTVDHWYRMCKEFFPRYVEHWAQHPDVLDRTPLLQESAFDVPYQLPSGRTVRLRGKWDAVDLVDGGVYLAEHKTKSTIDEVKLKLELSSGFELQTQFYLTALTEALCPTCRGKWTKAKAKILDESPNLCPNCGGKPFQPFNYASEWKRPEPEFQKGLAIAGVRYNVVRRPAHKTVESAVKKFEEDAKAGRLAEWFARWRIEIQPADIARFRRECLDPILENLCDDHEHWKWIYDREQLGRETGGGVFDYKFRAEVFPRHKRRHYRTCYHYNPLAEGGSGDVDHYLNTGQRTGLVRREILFPELQ